MDKKEYKKADINEMYDVIVVGAGPAAISSSIYSIRKGLKTLMIGDAVGGQVITTGSIENIIGTISTTGFEFSKALENHAKDYELPFHQGHLVTKIKDLGSVKEVYTDDDLVFKTKTVIIATGAKHRELNVKGEEEYKGKGVHYCSTCDGPFYRNLDVCIVGGGNSGVEAALDLVNIAKSVTLVEYLDELKADKVLQEKLFENDKISVITSAKIEEITGETFVTKLKYTDRKTNTLNSINVDGVFVEIGLLANTKVFEDLVELNKIGEIKIDSENKTTVSGIFAAGDCTDVKYKQIIISLGEGAKAALSAFNYILNN